jgi:CDP-diacylglycerol--glycerol-3-phosphate 3-phosphatidyltransferase
MTNMSWLRALPNLLTGARIVLGVLVFALLAAARLTVALGGLRAFVLLAFAAFVIAAATDFFDGWLARRLSAQSAWGAMLDPIADKIAVLAAVLGLVWLAPRLSVAIPGFLILMRELFVSGLREAGGARGVRFPVTQLAKWKTTIQLVALSAEILASGGLLAPSVSAAADGLLWIAALLTLWTGLDYARAAAAQL